MKTTLRIAAVGALALALLTACGGGTSQIEAFKPGRILVFGDEHSAFAPDGRKYTVNALKTDGTLDCELNPLWIQSVAVTVGLRFAQCQGSATEAHAVTYAVPGATVAGVRSQIDANASTLGQRDLVLMMAGLHDVIEIYEARSASDTDELLLERARERGVLMAEQVNRMIGLGARVVVSTMPDMGLTPWALAKGETDAKLLTQMSLAFNARLRVGIVQDGRLVGLVLADELLQSAATVPQAYALSNITAAVCAPTAPLPTCTNAASSLIPDASELTFMWADSKFFGSTMHRSLGLTASSLVSRLPF